MIVTEAKEVVHERRELKVLYLTFSLRRHKRL